MHTHPDARIWYHASNMVLNVHLDTSYLSIPNAHSQAASYFFLGSLPQASKPIAINSAISILCTVLCFVTPSAAKAELGALFLNAKNAK